MFNQKNPLFKRVFLILKKSLRVVDETMILEENEIEVGKSG
ncbi:MAG: hypothetical protein QMD86_00860 [Patescibacteria group bacterium]|nr:hypothetical protein [Patescibacteria group bacterium]